VSLFAGEERKAEVAGAIMLVALAGAVVFAVFLSGRIHFGSRVRVRVDFDQVSGLVEGADVIVAGRKVGVVDSITLVPEEGGGVAAFVQIDRARRDMVPVNGEFFVSSRGLLSERYLEVGPPPDGAAPGRPIEEGDRVHGVSPPTLDRAIQRTWDNLERTRQFAAEVGPEAHELYAQIGALGETLGELDPGPTGWNGLAEQWRASIDQARTAWATLGASGADPAHLEALADSASRTMLVARRALALVRARAQVVSAAIDRASAQGEHGRAAFDKLRDALAKLDATTAKLDHVLATAQALADSFARGEGSIAKLARDPEFPEDAKALGRILKNEPWRIVGHPPDQP
jgi:phospholipid/cholesterol/gamma-HCH transport system substrate-binding protein